MTSGYSRQGCIISLVVHAAPKRRPLAIVDRVAISLVVHAPRLPPRPVLRPAPAIRRSVHSLCPPTSCIAGCPFPLPSHCRPCPAPPRPHTHRTIRRTKQGKPTKQNAARGTAGCRACSALTHEEHSHTATPPTGTTRQRTRRQRSGGSDATAAHEDATMRRPVCSDGPSRWPHHQPFDLLEPELQPLGLVVIFRRNRRRLGSLASACRRRRSETPAARRFGRSVHSGRRIYAGGAGAARAARAAGGARAARAAAF